MKKATPLDITRAAIDTAFDEFRKNEFVESGSQLMHLLKQAIEEHEMTVMVTITTSNGDVGPIKEKIATAISKKINRPVTIEERSDPSMIGGVKIEYNDERIDMSLKKALMNAKEALEIPSLAL